MAMDYAYPIHWDHEFARNCEFGGLVAPQSMAAADALDLGHGCQPAGVGRIPGSRRVDDEKAGESSWGLPLVKLKVKLKNRDGSTLVDATALVELTLG
ncbi:MAG: acyl dehydratase [Hydrocarboniphaga sp.]|nr:acyl dehydratase [Hydrocarboniphaga sp.]